MAYLEITREKEYAVIQMKRPKVNAINFQMVDEIRATFKELDADDSVNGVILTGLGSVFSAGLDLIELYDYDEAKMKEFFIAFSQMHIELVQFSKPFICAINGHSPAGGTVIAIAADYRIMAEGEKYTMGLNEVAVNVQISMHLIESYSFWLGRGAAYQYILAGKLLNTKESLQSGLVQEVVAAEEVMARAKKRMEKYLQADPAILINTKAKLRKEWLEKFNTLDGDQELEQALKIWWSEEVRMRMQFFIAYLKEKKK